MALQIDPEFLSRWVEAELEASGDGSALAARARMDVQLAAEGGDELDEDEARSEAAAALAEKRGLIGRLEAAAEGLSSLQIREARSGSERLERSAPKLFEGPPSCTAWLLPAAGAAARLELLAQALLGKPGALVAELEGPLGGSPGCSVR